MSIDLSDKEQFTKLEGDGPKDQRALGQWNVTYWLPQDKGWEVGMIFVITSRTLFQSRGGPMALQDYALHGAQIALEDLKRLNTGTCVD